MIIITYNDTIIVQEIKPYWVHK